MPCRALSGTVYRYNRWVEVLVNLFLNAIIVQDSLWHDFEAFRKFWLDGTVPGLVSPLLNEGDP